MCKYKFVTFSYYSDPNTVSHMPMFIDIGVIGHTDIKDMNVKLKGGIS